MIFSLYFANIGVIILDNLSELKIILFDIKFKQLVSILDKLLKAVLYMCSDDNNKLFDDILKRLNLS
jgi:hypothetical protein